MILVLILIFLAVTLIISFSLLIIYRQYYSPELQAIRRLEQFTKTATSAIAENADVPFIVRDDELSKIPILNILLEKFNITKNLQKTINQAGLKIKVGELILYAAVLAVFGFIVTIKSHNIILKLLCILILGFLPIMYVNTKKSNRLKAFIRQFPDSLDMMTSAIRAGHGFNKAILLVADEAPDPVSTEFRAAYEEHNLGLQFREAMINLTERVDSLDLKLFVTAVLLQRETGGNMAEMLDKISYTIRERFKLIGQIRTLTAQGRMSAWVIGGLPFFFILIISVMNPGYLEPLFNDKLGHFILGAAGIMQILGILIIQRIVKIKYQ